MTGLLCETLSLLGSVPPAGTHEDLCTHLHRFGARPGATGPAGSTLIRTLDQIGLSGRGGAHFPVATKWWAVRAAGRAAAAGATVVANAAEGEPASAKDRTLLARRPHLVLDGLFSAAEAVGADELVVWLHHDDRASRRVLAVALREYGRAGWPVPPVQLAAAPAAYLSGESSAIVRGLSGGPVLPQFTLVPAALSGVRGRPTLVQNVETLARVGLAARTGVAGHHPTVLLTVLVLGARRVIEVPPDCTVAEAVDLAGWPSTRDGWDPPVAVLLGGYGGTWLPWRTAAGLPVGGADRAARARTGAGVVAPLAASTCGLAETAAVAGYLAASGAGQCGPCLHGLPAIARILHALTDGQASHRDMHRLARHLDEVPGRGGCHLPDGAARFVRSALATFGDEVAAHLRGNPCPTRGRPRTLPVPASRPLRPARTVG